MDVKAIDEQCIELIKNLGLPCLREANPYVVLGVRGDGIRASEKWNARVYRDSRGRLKLVTSDLKTLQDLLEGRSIPLRERTVKVDDAGWGFPLGGVMIGAEECGRIKTGVVPVEYFQGERFERHEYLRKAAEVTMGLLKKLGARPGDTLVEICTGYVNVGSKNALRDAGYEVKVVEITGLLQTELEKRFGEYVETLGYHGYVDPKETHDQQSPFNRIIAWVMEKPEERMGIAKTGWKFFKSRNDK
jgi:hypothetical protein